MPSVPFLSDPEELRRLGEALSLEPLIAVDTEADSLHSYRGKLCLLQIATPGDVCLVDALALDDLSPLRPAFESESITVVLHGADYDLRILDRDAGLRLRGIFDTMVAARLLGRERFGLSHLAAEELDVRLDKSHQRADWSRRPLPDSLIAYAADDTRHLPPLHDRLEEGLREAGRLDWAREEFRLLEEIRHEDADPDPEPWRRVKGASRLDPRAQTILREIHRWREDLARRADRPPFKILGREALLEVARRAPRTRRDLGRIPGLGRPILARHGEGLLDAVGRGLRAELVPRRSRTAPPPRDPVAESAMRRLKRLRDERAGELRLDPGLLLPNAVLERVVAASRAGEGDPFDVEGVRRWQAAELRERLAEALPPRAGG